MVHLPVPDGRAGGGAGVPAHEAAHAVAAAAGPRHPAASLPQPQAGTGADLRYLASSTWQALRSDCDDLQAATVPYDRCSVDACGPN